VKIIEFQRFYEFEIELIHLELFINFGKFVTFTLHAQTLQNKALALLRYFVAFWLMVEKIF